MNINVIISELCDNHDCVNLTEEAFLYVYVTFTNSLKRTKCKLITIIIRKNKHETTINVIITVC